MQRRRINDGSTTTSSPATLFGHFINSAFAGFLMLFIFFLVVATIARIRNGGSWHGVVTGLLGYYEFELGIAGNAGARSRTFDIIQIQASAIRRSAYFRTSKPEPTTRNPLEIVTLLRQLRPFRILDPILATSVVPLSVPVGTQLPAVANHVIETKRIGQLISQRMRFESIQRAAPSNLIKVAVSRSSIATSTCVLPLRLGR